MILVTCNGCFDGLHPGHMYYLGYCQAQGDELVVGINCDEYIRMHKVRDPIPEQERVAALMALGFIKDVVVFKESEPSAFIRRVKPNVNCVGVEYQGEAPEEKICQELGIKMVYVPRVGDWSSTKMRMRIE